MGIFLTYLERKLATYLSHGVKYTILAKNRMVTPTFAADIASAQQHEQ